jgi:hypothetical protein
MLAVSVDNFQMFVETHSLYPQPRPERVHILIPFEKSPVKRGFLFPFCRRYFLSLSPRSFSSTAGSAARARPSL